MNDTDPDIARVHANLLREAGQSRRIQMAFALTNHVVNSSKRAIAAQYPHMTEAERRVKFVEVAYGPELAAKVHAYLAARGEM